MHTFQGAAIQQQIQVNSGSFVCRIAQLDPKDDPNDKDEQFEGQERIHIMSEFR